MRLASAKLSVKGQVIDFVEVRIKIIIFTIIQVVQMLINVNVPRKFSSEILQGTGSPVFISNNLAYGVVDTLSNCAFSLSPEGSLKQFGRSVKIYFLFSHYGIVSMWRTYYSYNYDWIHSRFCTTNITTILSYIHL